MLINKEITKEEQSVEEEVLGQRISDVIRQIQAWAIETYREAQATPEFVIHPEVPGYPKRVRICSEESSDQCTIIIPDNNSPTMRPVRLWARFNNQPELYFYDLRVKGKQKIEVTEVKNGDLIEVEPMVRTLVIKKARQIFEQPSSTVGLERKVYSGTPDDPKTSWQALKTESLSVFI